MQAPKNSFVEEQFVAELGAVKIPVLPYEISEFVSNRSAAISNACAKIADRIDNMQLDPAAVEQDSTIISTAIQIYYDAAVAAKEILSKGNGKLAPHDVENLNELRSMALEHMNSKKSAINLLAARQISLVEPAMRNAVYLALDESYEDPNKEDRIKNLIYVIESVKDAKVRNVWGLDFGGKAHEVDAGQSAWDVITQREQAGEPVNPEVKQIIEDNFGPPRDASGRPNLKYELPSKVAFIVGIPLVGLAPGEALRLQKTLQDQAMGVMPDSSARTSKPRDTSPCQL